MAAVASSPPGSLPSGAAIPSNRIAILPSSIVSPSRTWVIGPVRVPRKQSAAVAGQGSASREAIKPKRARGGRCLRCPGRAPTGVGRALPGRAGTHPAAVDRAHRRRGRRHLRHAACRRDSQPRCGAGRPGGSIFGRFRSLAGGCRVMPERADLELDTLTIRIPIRLQRRGGRKLIMTPKGVAAPARKPRREETLSKARVRAHHWRRRIESGQAKSITDLAEQEGVTEAYVCRLLPLTCLAPDIV